MKFYLALCLCTFFSIQNVHAGNRSDLKIFPEHSHFDVMVGDQLQFSGVFHSIETHNAWWGLSRTHARWSVNSSSGRIDANGRFTALKPGNITVTVKAIGKTKSVKFRVIKRHNISNQISRGQFKLTIYPSLNRSLSVRAGTTLHHTVVANIGRLFFTPSSGVSWRMIEGQYAGQLLANGVFKAHKKAANRYRIEAKWRNKQAIFQGSISRYGTPQGGSDIYAIMVTQGKVKRILLGQSTFITARAVLKNGNQTNNFNCRFYIEGLKDPQGTHRLRSFPGTMKTSTHPCRLNVYPKKAGIYSGRVRVGMRQDEFQIYVSHPRKKSRVTQNQRNNARRALEAKRKAAAYQRCKRLGQCK